MSVYLLKLSAFLFHWYMRCCFGRCLRGVLAVDLQWPGKRDYRSCTTEASTIEVVQHNYHSVQILLVILHLYLTVLIHGSDTSTAGFFQKSAMVRANYFTSMSC